MIKTGDSAKVVDKAQAVAQTRPGTIGVKVSILSPEAVLTDKIVIDEEFLKRIRENEQKPEETKNKIRKNPRSKK